MKIFLKGDITTSTKVKSLINRLGIEFKSKNDYLFEGNEIIGIEYSFFKVNYYEWLCQNKSKNVKHGIKRNTIIYINK